MKHVRFAIAGGIICAIAGIFTWSVLNPSSKPLNPVLIQENQNIKSLELPTVLDFAGEPVPLYNFDVAEALDRELMINTYWHSQTMTLIKKSKRFFAVIEPILKENGIPDDFKYIPVAESGFNNLTSPASAVGIWQFLEGTAKDYGLEVNKEIDERYHLEKSTQAACKFLTKSNELYKSWTMAAASYNIGRSNLNKLIKKQKNDYYYDMLLGDETQRYVFRLLAFKLIMENPAKYGFEIEEKDYYPVIPTYSVSIDSTIQDLAQFAIDKGINYKILKMFNPWLRDNYISNKKKKTYHLTLPVKGYRNLDYTPHPMVSDTLLLNQ